MSGYALVEENLRHIHSCDLLARGDVSQHAAPDSCTRDRSILAVSRNECSGLGWGNDELDTEGERDVLFETATALIIISVDSHAK